MWIPTQSQWAFCSFSTYFLGKKGNFIVKPIQFLYFGVGLWDVFFFFFTANLYRHTTYKLQIICVVCLYIRYCPRLSNQVEHQTTSAYFENKYFFTKSCHRQTYQNYEQPPQSLQNLYFQSHFLASKINRIFLIFFSVKRSTWKWNKIFWKLWFLKYFVF